MEFDFFQIRQNPSYMTSEDFIHPEGVPAPVAG